MELRTTREMRRNEQLANTAARKPEGESAPARAKPAQVRATEDKLSLSRQALSWLEEQNRKMWEQDLEREQRRQDRMNDSLSSLESAKKELDAMGRQLKVLRICQKIAASIMKGDRVPPEDLEYLMNNDPEGYKLAMAMRHPKEDPEDVESALEKEDGSSDTRKTEGTGEAAPVADVPVNDEAASAE